MSDVPKPKARPRRKSTKAKSSDVNSPDASSTRVTSAKPKSTDASKTRTKTTRLKTSRSRSSDSTSTERSTPSATSNKQELAINPTLSEPRTPRGKSSRRSRAGQSKSQKNGAPTSSNAPLDAEIIAADVADDTQARDAAPADTDAPKRRKRTRRSTGETSEAAAPTGAKKRAAKSTRRQRTPKRDADSESQTNSETHAVTEADTAPVDVLADAATDEVESADEKPTSRPRRGARKTKSETGEANATRGKKVAVVGADEETASTAEPAESTPKQTKKSAAKRSTQRKRPPLTTSFATLGITEPLLGTITELGFTTPTDIQEVLIPPALDGRDCLGQAKTGTGKTAAFGLPLLETLSPGEGVQALILAPTRELAGQVDAAIRSFNGDGPFQTAVVYGGKRIDQDAKQLKGKPELIIATPGRALDLIRRKLLDISHLRCVVLDEVDRMLDIGFRDDIRKILESIKIEHQTIFVSATIDDEIRKLAKKYMNDPLELNVSGDSLTVEHIEHGFAIMPALDKFASLEKFIKVVNPPLAIVFTNTKHQADRVARRLKKDGLRCQEIHGDLRQAKREIVMKKFRDSKIQVLVATDLAARGLDVSDVSHVINYDVPADPAVYVHRIGRTARAGQSGYAVTFITPEDGKVLTEIEKLINCELKQFEEDWIVRTGAMPEARTKSEHIDEADRQAMSPERYRNSLSRDAVLDSLGFKPVQRTLGSRFRAPRKRR